MESAIPEHLRQHRTQEGNAPAGFQPPNPAWVARFSPSVGQVVMAYFGIQSWQVMDDAPFKALRTHFASAGGPAHWECARYIDAQGYDTKIAIAYWDKPTDFNSWRANSGFDAWWQSPARLTEPYGYFLEVVSPTADRFETLRSSPEHPEGVARLESHLSGEIKEHAYWGSMRDRLPISQVDPLKSPTQPHEQPPTAAQGKRVVVPAHENLSLIRSGQDWSATTGLERLLYLNEMQPILRAGMNFLRDEGQAIGCLSCRYMTVLDEDGRSIEKTFGLAHFDNLANLELWARTHPTHLAIFGGFQKYVQDLNFKIKLRLYHEVTVVPASGQYFEYVNCHHGTGLLGRG
jgi:aldoxime dehydratase